MGVWRRAWGSACPGRAQGERAERDGEEDAEELHSECGRRGRVEGGRKELLRASRRSGIRTMGDQLQGTTATLKRY